MGDEDRTEQPTPQEPPREPEPEPDGSAQAGAARDDATGPRPPAPDDATAQLPSNAAPRLSGDATAQLPGDTAPRLPGDATTRLPGDATTPRPGDAASQFPDDATTRLPAADHTRMMPPAPAAWEGRAEVRPQHHPGLRDSAPYPVAEPPPQKARTWWTPLLLGMLALGLVGLVVLAAWLLGRDASPDPVTTDTPGPIVPTTATPLTPTTQAAPSPTPSPTPELVEVPPLLGDTQAEATAKLDAAGLSYRFDFRRDNAPRDTVIATDPAAGARVPRLATIVLVLSLGPADTTPTARPTPTASAEPG